MQTIGESGSKRGGAGRGGGRGERRGSGQKGGFGAGPGGDCVCPSCGKTTPHDRGVPCIEVHCPECGSGMTRGR